MNSEEENLKRIFFLECDELLASAEQSVESQVNPATQRLFAPVATPQTVKTLAWTPWCPSTPTKPTT